MIAPLNKILDGLYLGNIDAASNYGILKKHNITHILTVAVGLAPIKSLVRYIQYFIIIGLQVEKDRDLRCAIREPGETFPRSLRVNSFFLIPCVVSSRKQSKAEVRYLCTGKTGIRQIFIASRGCQGARAV